MVHDGRPPGLELNGRRRRGLRKAVARLVLHVVALLVVAAVSRRKDAAARGFNLTQSASGSCFSCQLHKVSVDFENQSLLAHLYHLLSPDQRSEDSILRRAA